MGRMIRLLFWAGLTGIVLWGLHQPFMGISALGPLLDPVDGLYRTARHSAHPTSETVQLAGLDGSVRIVRDTRGVPHIFASSDRDAIRAMGYVVAQDRLFQLDFIPRVAAGRLSSAFGASSVSSDQFLRRTGMDWGAKKNIQVLEAEPGQAWETIEWYVSGVNAYMDGLDEADLPFEFRLLGYRPDPYTPLQAMRLLQYMAYDLTFRTDDASYGRIKERLGETAFAALYPLHNPLSVPIIPEAGGRVPEGEERLVAPGTARAKTLLDRLLAIHAQQAGTVAEGFIPGKGSNNWAVGGARSTTGAPILAGDMHLTVSLPAIWYEVHLVTPEMNTYGVALPGSPLPVEAFNEHVAWAFTNTGSDQIDHLVLELDETGTRYRYEGAFRDLEMVIDTIEVKGGDPVVDTLYYSHWGPLVEKEGTEAIALRWVAHDPSRTLQALWGMNHAQDYAAFEDALRFWDTPMQNILYADVQGNIAIRSTGYMPLRASGHGIGLLDGSTDAHAWIGRVPFDELPHSINPEQGFLSSTNQQPADPAYPYYMGFDWRSTYRSMRINTLLNGQEQHSVADLKRYHADVHAVQYDLFVPLLSSLNGLSAQADTLRQLLVAWDGDTGVDRPEPLVLEVFLDVLHTLTWDEPAFEQVRKPSEAILYTLLTTLPDATWLDVQVTPEKEDATLLLMMALEQAADQLAETYGNTVAGWRWGDHHKVLFRHITQTPALRALWRGPMEYPGFRSTLSPASSHATTHSASWRVVVDLSQSPPVGYGIYPGGQQGNPLSPLYDTHLDDYVQFRHYPLLKPAAADDMPTEQVRSTLILNP